MFAIANTFRSRATVNVRGFVSQVDPTGPSSTTSGHIMSLLRTRRAAASTIAGGILLTQRAPWDTAVNAPDSGVEIRYSAGYYAAPGGELTATAGDRIWQQFTSRAATQVRQRKSEDFSQTPKIGADVVVLAPGDALVVECLYGTRPTGGTATFMLAWAEDQTDAGYILGGKVTLDSANVSGAKVHVLTAADLDMTDAKLQTLTTNGTGDYSTTLSTSTKASVFVQHRDGGTLYTDEGKPFIEP